MVGEENQHGDELKFLRGCEVYSYEKIEFLLIIVFVKLEHKVRMLCLTFN